MSSAVILCARVVIVGEESDAMVTGSEEDGAVQPWRLGLSVTGCALRDQT